MGSLHSPQYVFSPLQILNSGTPVRKPSPAHRNLGVLGLHLVAGENRIKKTAGGKPIISLLFLLSYYYVLHYGWTYLELSFREMFL